MDINSKILRFGLYTLQNKLLGGKAKMKIAKCG
jgi:hypothetical protein